MRINISVYYFIEPQTNIITHSTRQKYATYGGRGTITQEWRYNGLRLELGGFARNAKQGIGRMVTCTQLLLNSKLTSKY